MPSPQEWQELVRRGWIADGVGHYSPDGGGSWYNADMSPYGAPASPGGGGGGGSGGGVNSSTPGAVFNFVTEQWEMPAATAKMWTGNGPQGYGTYYLDDNGQPGTYIGNPQAPSQAGVSVSLNPGSTSAWSRITDPATGDVYDYNELTKEKVLVFKGKGTTGGESYPGSGITAQGISIYAIPSSKSPTGYVLADGRPVNPDGSLYTGGGEVDTPTTRQDATGNTYQFNPKTGKWDLLWGPKPSTPSSGGGGGGGGGGGYSGPARDYAGEAAAGDAAAMQRLLAQQGFQGGQNDLDRAFQLWKTTEELGLSKTSLGLSAAKQLADVIGSYDPAALPAFYAAGGGNIINALRGGATALSSNAMLPAALTLALQRGMGSSGGGTGMPAPGGGAGPVASGTDIPPPVAGNELGAAAGAVSPVATADAGGARRQPSVVKWADTSLAPAIPSPGGLSDSQLAWASTQPGGVEGMVDPETLAPWYASQKPKVYAEGPNPGGTIPTPESATKPLATTFEEAMGGEYTIDPVTGQYVKKMARGGMTRAQMFLGDERGREMYVNPTGAPIGVVPHGQTERMMDRGRMTGVKGFAGGTYIGSDPYASIAAYFGDPMNLTSYYGNLAGSYQAPAPAPVPAPTTYTTQPITNDAAPAQQPVASAPVSPSTVSAPPATAAPPPPSLAVPALQPTPSPGAIPASPVVSPTVTSPPPVTATSLPIMWEGGPGGVDPNNPLGPPAPVVKSEGGLHSAPPATQPGFLPGIESIPANPYQAPVPAGLESIMDEIRNLRENVQYPQLNTRHIGFSSLLDSLKKLYFQGVQTKYGVPVEDQLQEELMWRLPQASKSSVKVGY